jgi:hypothetical protein
VHVAAKDTLASKRISTVVSNNINKYLNWSSMTVPAMMCAVAGLTWVLTK